MPTDAAAEEQRFGTVLNPGGKDSKHPVESFFTITNDESIMTKINYLNNGREALDSKNVQEAKQRKYNSKIHAT